MEPETGGPRIPMWVWLVAAGVAVLAYMYYRNQAGGGSSGSPSTSGGGGTITAGSTTLNKGAVQVTVTQESPTDETGKNPQPKPHTKKRHVTTTKTLTTAQQNELKRAGIASPKSMSSTAYAKDFTSSGDPRPWLLNRSTQGNPGRKPGSNEPKKPAKRG